MENNTTNQNVVIGNLTEVGNSDVLGSSLIPQEQPTPLFKVIKNMGIFAMVVWVLFLFFVFVGIGLIGAGAGGTARFYNAYGGYLFFFEFALAVSSAITIYNSKKYITAIAPLLLLIIGIIGFTYFDILA